MRKKMIPLIVHQTEETLDQIPDSVAETMKEFRKINPNVEFRFYSADERRRFLIENFPERYIRAYDSIKPEYGVAKADLFRYCVVYNSGGFYVDAKSMFTKPLSEICKRKCELLLVGSDFQRKSLVSLTDPRKFLNRFGNLQGTAVFAGSPQNEFLYMVILAVLENIESYLPHRHGVGLKGVFSTTGPYVFTRTLANCKNKESIDFVSLEDSGFLFRRGVTRRSSQATGRNHYSLNFTPVIAHNPIKNNFIYWKFSCLLGAIYYSPGVLESRLRNFLDR
jgi:mannosyltransferase OCH1-like enzyme